MANPLILVVEDDPPIRNLIAMGEPVRVLFDRLMRKEGKDPQKQRVISRRTLEKGYTYIIDKYDRNAFVIISETKDVNGEGFTYEVRM